MNEKRVWVFFYGTFMDSAVLAANEIIAEAVPARLHGYQLEIKNRANLIRTDRGVVYGSIAKLSHDELRKLYQKIQDTVGLIYLPEATLAELLDGSLQTALCYIVPQMEAGTPDAEYLGQMVAAAEAIRAPDWYLTHIKSFGPEK